MSKWAMERALFERRFAVTEMGYMGLVPREAEVGDQVVIFLGTRTPFIIRRSTKVDKDGDRTATLIGECFIRGMMNGEVFDIAQTHEDFVLI